MKTQNNHSKKQCSGCKRWAFRLVKFGSGSYCSGCVESIRAHAVGMACASPLPTSRIPLIHRRRLTAIHESAHLIALIELFPGATDYGLEIFNDNGGRCDYGPDFDPEAEKAVVVHMAGYHAELLAWLKITGRKATPNEICDGFQGSGKDVVYAMRIFAKAAPEKRIGLMQRSSHQLCYVLEQRWDDIITLANALLERCKLTYVEILDLLSTRSLTVV